MGDMTKPIEPIRQLANASGYRIESGPAQVGQDWPGVFIRGDEASAYADDLERLTAFGLPPQYVGPKTRLGRLIRLLRSCKV